MAVNYYYQGKNLEDVCATARVSIAPDTVKGKYYNNGSDIALKFAIPPEGSHLYKMSSRDLDISKAYQPLLLLEKGKAPHIETDLKRSGATTYTLTQNGSSYATYTITYTQSQYKIYKHSGSADTFKDPSCVLDDFRPGMKSIAGKAPELIATINLPSGVSPVGRKIYLECCGAGGGGGGSSGSTASGGGGSAACVSGIVNLAAGADLTITLGPWGSGGSSGNKNNTTNGGDGGYAALTFRSSTSISQNNGIYYYAYKTIVLYGGCGGSRGGSSHGLMGAGGSIKRFYGSIGYRKDGNQAIIVNSVFNGDGAIGIDQGFFSDAAYEEFIIDGEVGAHPVARIASFYTLDDWSGVSGGDVNHNAQNQYPLSCNLTPNVSISSGSGTFSGGGQYGGGASGMGVGSQHRGQDPGPGGGGNGRPSAASVTNPGEAGFHGGTACCKLYFY